MQDYRHRLPEQSSENLAEQVASRYLPYWPVFIIALIAAAGLSFLYLRYKVPIYEADATILINDERKGNEDKLTESLDLVSSKKTLENEVELLKSRNLMVEVVKKLNLYAPVYIEGSIHDVLAYTRSPIVVVAAKPDSLREKYQVKFTYNDATRTVTLDQGPAYPLDSIVSTPYGDLKFISNVNYDTTLVEPGDETKLYFLLGDPQDAASGLLGNLEIEPSSKLSSVVNMTFTDTDMKRAEDVLRELINAYGRSEMLLKNKLANYTLSFVEDRLRLVAADLDSIEKKVQQYKSGTGAVDVSTQGQLFLKNVSENDQKLSEINMQLSVLDQVSQFISSNNGTANAIVPSTLGVGDPVLSQLLDKLYAYELEYQKLRSTVGENNPSLLSLRQQINQLRPAISQNIESRRRTLTAAKNNLNLTNQGYNSMLQSVPQKERRLLDISREQATKTNIYAFLLQKREESELATASTMSDHMVIDDARAKTTPVSPVKLLVFLIAIGGCLGLCFMYITIRESFNGKILYRHEVESRTSIPIIGEIAYNKSKTLIEAGTRSFIAEEFRRVRNSLSFLGIDASHKKILITSSISGEGKSFISVNLAVSLSLTGKKVVLVDMDLNNPTVGKILNVSRDMGVTEYLMGTSTADEVIGKLHAFDNLYYISAGEIPDNPTELLANGRAEELLDYLNGMFDVVVIDTSPIILVTDGYILSPLCDATLYVVRHNYTPKVLVKRIDANNKINPIKNPAIIFNGVKMKGFFKNNYGYGYDYVYSSKSKRKKPQKPLVKNKR
jgi:capsular exopolysaccharide synthesis family protein